MLSFVMKVKILPFIVDILSIKVCLVEILSYLCSMFQIRTSVQRYKDLAKIKNKQLKKKI